MSEPEDPKLKETQRLLEVVARLRRECPWDKEQTHKSLAPYLIEESYETLDAIEARDSRLLEEELGDVLLQVVLHAEIANETDQFNFESIAKVLADKMVFRHPHVFGDADIKNIKELRKKWAELKGQEKKRESAMDEMPKNLPALQYAQKMGSRAAAQGFDWENPAQVLAKIEEEVDELKEAFIKNNQEAVHEELGDLLFAISNFARHSGIDAESCLRSGCKKFEGRYRKLEKECTKPMSEYTVDELETLWQSLKKK